MLRSFGEEGEEGDYKSAWFNTFFHKLVVEVDLGQALMTGVFFLTACYSLYILIDGIHSNMIVPFNLIEVQIITP